MVRVHSTPFSKAFLPNNSFTVMPECFYRASISLLDNGFPIKTCGNDYYDGVH